MTSNNGDHHQKREREGKLHKDFFGNFYFFNRLENLLSKTCLKVHGCETFLNCYGSQKLKFFSELSKELLKNQMQV